MISLIPFAIGQFRTFGIPTISKLLHATREYEDSCSRRYDDTDLILREILENSPDSERGATAIDRLNKLHENYKISNNDFLYTLGIFVVTPVRFINRHSYRRLGAYEVDCVHQVMSRMGEKMGIRGIPPTYASMRDWFDAYEEKNMRFEKSNGRVGKATLDFFLKPFPRLLRPVVEEFVLLILDERLKASLGLRPRAGLIWSLLRFPLSLIPPILPLLSLLTPPSRNARRTPKAAEGDVRFCPMKPLWHPMDRNYETYQIARLGPKKYENT